MRWGLHNAPLLTPVLSPKAALSPRAAQANSAGSSTCQFRHACAHSHMLTRTHTTRFQQHAWRSFPNVGTRDSSSSVVGIIPHQRSWRTSPCPSQRWLEGTDTQELTSQAPLQPYYLPFRPTVTQLLRMHIFRDCKTMAEARVGRLVVKNIKFIDPITCEK